MSAFIVENSCIAEIVRSLSASQHCRQMCPLYGLAPLSPDFQFDLTTSHGRKLLAVEMLQMNADAVGQRYPDEQPFHLAGADLSGGKTVSPLHLLKRLNCYVYQCGEGDVRQRPLYKALRKACDRLAQNICGECDEYKAAPWG